MNFPQLQNTWLGNLGNLLYPETCTACGRHLQHHEQLICLFCEQNLPQTNYHLETDNPIAKHFWGRIQLEQVAAYYFFSKGSRVQKLIHQLKYQGNRDIGIKIGQLYGKVLVQTLHFQTIDLIIPIPLHPKKQQKRGYNQSDLFAEGLSETMGINWSPEAIKRSVFSDTQTRKTRYNRWKNVDSIFAIQHTEQLHSKHILLVDDVITTGATIEACATEILALPNTKVSAVTIACAQHIA